MGEEASEPPAIFNFALHSVKAKAAAGTGFSEVKMFSNRAVFDPRQFPRHALE
jgi:hypothetical protein